MRNILLSLLVSIVVFSLFGCQSAGPIKNGKQVGVILLHGKGGTTNHISGLASTLMSSGAQVMTPDMSWHRDRIYDKTFQDSMAEIDTYVQKLKKQGVTRIFVGGHSLGAIAAAGYAKQYGNIDGVILLAPGHMVGNYWWASDEIDSSEKLIDQGKGETIGTYTDVNQGQFMTRELSATIYHSWFDARSAGLLYNLRKMSPDVAVLYLAGDSDRVPESNNKNYAFIKAPKNPKNKFVLLSSGHISVPDNAGSEVVNWINLF